MSWLAALLGGIEGASTNLSGNLDKKYTTKLKADENKSDWARQVLKGLMLQNMRYGGNQFDFSELVDDEQMPGVIDPDLIGRISKGFPRGTGRRTPFGAGSTTPVRRQKYNPATGKIE